MWPTKQYRTRQRASVPLGRSDARGGRAGTMGGRREAPSCPAPLGAGLGSRRSVLTPLGAREPVLPLDRRARLPTSATPPAPSRPPGCSDPDSAPLEAGLASRRSVQPRRFRLHNANADGSLLANLLSLTAFVRTGGQSVEPIAVNHVDAARGALARTHRRR